MLRRMLSPPDLTRANRSKKARSSRRRGSATNMNYTMQINFILLAIVPGGSVTCRALFVVSCGRDGWPLLFSNFFQEGGVWRAEHAPAGLVVAEREKTT